MPAVQTTYLAQHARAYVGMEADSESAGHRNLSRTVETAAIGFGIAVSQGAGDHGIVAFSSTATKFLGITVRDQSVDPKSPEAYRVGDTASVKIEGAIWVTAAAPVSAGDPVYLDANGNFTNVATNNAAVPRATFRTSAAATTLALVRLQ